MFTLLFQQRQGYPAPREQPLFIPLDAACIAIFQSHFNLGCISLSGRLKKKKSFKNCCCIIATPTATQQHTQDLCVPESCKTCAICNILTVQATQCKKKSHKWTKTKYWNWIWAADFREAQIRAGCPTSPCYKHFTCLISLASGF